MTKKANVTRSTSTMGISKFKRSRTNGVFQKIKRDDVSSRMLINQVKMYSDGISINSTAKTLEKYKFEWFTGTPYGLNYIQKKNEMVVNRIK